MITTKGWRWSEGGAGFQPAETKQGRSESNTDGSHYPVHAFTMNAWLNYCPYCTFSSTACFMRDQFMDAETFRLIFFDYTAPKMSFSVFVLAPGQSAPALKRHKHSVTLAWIPVNTAFTTAAQINNFNLRPFRITSDMGRRTRKPFANIRNNHWFYLPDTNFRSLQSLFSVS